MELVIIAAILFLVVGFLGFLISLYNSFVSLKNNMEKSWVNIDVLLKQRHDEIPNLVETCKGYMTHERNVLEQLTRTRTQYINVQSIEKKTQAENELTRGLMSLFAVAENYPDLKANQNFLQIQGRISALENEIADRREFFNDSVTLYNTRIEQFPNVILAYSLGFDRRSLLEIPEVRKHKPQIRM